MLEVKVRVPREEDLDAFFRIHADPQTNIHSRDGGTENLEQARGMLGVVMDSWRQDGIGYWTVTDDEDRVIGFSGLRVKQAGPADYLNLYYRYTPEVWGQGIAKHVASLAMALAREQWPQRPVIARTRATNIPAQRVALAVGLARTGHDSDGRVVFADRRLYPSFFATLR